MPPVPLPRPASPSAALAEARALVRRGSLQRAAATLTGPVPEADGGAGDAERAERLALLVLCRLASGELATAGAHGEELAAHLDGAPRQAVLAHRAHADLAAAHGEHARALQHLRRAAALPDAGPATWLTPWRAEAALALLHLGRRADAAALAREQVALAEEGDAWQLAVALRALAIADASADPWAALRRGRILARAAGDRRLAARIDTDLAGLLLLTPSPDHVADAVRLLRVGEQYAAAEALWPLHSRIVRLLERAGERPRPLEGETLASLTPAEQRVARLAAQGLTNRGIAEQLGVTVKGVEWHLSRVYRKLGIGSREALGGLVGAPVEDATDRRVGERIAGTHAGKVRRPEPV